MSLALPPAPPRGLVQEKAGVGQAIPLGSWNRHEDQRAGTGHPPCTDHPHRCPNEADEIVDRIARLDVPALGVQVYRDRVIRFGCQREQLGGNAGCQLLGDLSTDDDGASAEQTFREGVARVTDFSRSRLAIFTVGHRRGFSCMEVDCSDISV
jgi:hypothetical protein